MKIKAVTLFTTLLFCLPTLAEINCKQLENKTLEATIVNVADGDTATVKLADKGDTLSVRFYGVATPESAWPGKWPEQAYSGEAKAFTVSALRGRDVNVVFNGDGTTYGHCVGEVFVNGRSHSLALLEGGYAWWYARYAPNRQDLADAQVKARLSRKGLWASQHPQEPWFYRKQHKD
jgi:endonuclease YncB( thermonuclease family)